MLMNKSGMSTKLGSPYSSSRRNVKNVVQGPFELSNGRSEQFI